MRIQNDVSAARLRSPLIEAQSQYDLSESIDADNGRPPGIDLHVRNGQLKCLRRLLKEAEEQIARGEFDEDLDEFWDLFESGADEADRRGDLIDPDVCQ